MKMMNHHLERLFKAAAQAPQDCPVEAPFALEIKAIRDWRTAAPEDESLFVARLFRWAFVGACLMVLLSVAANYQALQDAGPNVLSLADSAIKMSLLP